MKIDSPLFDSIRVKPSKDRRLKNDGPVCQWANCKEKATNFAPKGPNSTGRWHYCVKHVREYNQSYNFFSGMDDDAVRAYQKDALTGHRPTWKMGTGKKQAKPDLSALGGSDDPFGLFEGTGKEQKKARRDPHHPQCRAQGVRGAQPRGQRHQGAGLGPLQGPGEAPPS